MAKTLKLQAYVSAGFNKVMFNIYEQSNRGAAFGYFSNKFRASNGIILGSNKNPANDTADKNTIWVRGSNPEKDNNTVVVGKTRFAKIVEAVKEYNAFFADRKAPAAPVANRCAVIVG